MQIYLNHVPSKELVKLEITVEATIPMHDLFVAFVNNNETCGLMNGKDSDKYDEYYFRSVSHIVDAKTKYNNIEHNLRIGFYVSGGSFNLFLIDQSSELKENPVFDSIGIYEETYYQYFLLFNYKEYSTLQELGLEKLTFEEYVKKLIKEPYEFYQNKLYNLNTTGKNNFVSQKGFEEFLHDQESKKTN